MTRIAVAPDSRIIEFLKEQGIDTTRLAYVKIEHRVGEPLYFTVEMFAAAEESSS